MDSHSSDVRGVTAPAAVSESIPAKLLPFVLSLIAGSVDTIGFFGLAGLFTAHVTGNLVILAARLAAGDRVGKAIPIEVIRGGTLQTLQVTVGQRN